jgi:hypothetical protein
MSAGNPEDVVRSVQRWTFYALWTNTVSGDPWSVETGASQIQDVQRPFAVLAPLSGLEQTFSRTGLPQGDVRWNTSISINAFPEVAGTAREARARATRIQAALLGAVTRGMLLTSTTAPTESRYSHPFEIPLFDFDGLPIEGAGRSNTGAAYAGMFVVSHPCRTVEDPEDDRRFSVVMDLRLDFWAAGADLTAREKGPVTRHVPGSFLAP